MDELLVKYLLGEATDAERQAVQEWIGASSDNRQYFDHFRIIWTESRQLAAESKIDTEAAWQRFRSRIAQAQQPENVVAFAPAAKRRPRMAGMAAALVLLLTGSLTAYYFLSLRTNTIVLASGNKVRVDTLPDGSVITLNKNSRLTYNKDFNRSGRQVTLEGEGFFNVTPNKQKPFDIAANEVNIHVVGTSFNVKSSTQQTEVIVETGVVRVGVSRQAVTVNPMQKAIVTGHKLAVERNTGALYNYYRTKEFVCNNTPLYQLAEVLNTAYDTRIVISDNRVRNLRLTTTFRGMPLNDILKVVTETFNLTIEQQDGTIILK